MNTLGHASLVALAVYAAWALLLVVGIAALRTQLVARRKRSANGFSPWGDDVSPFSARLCRAHANCVENLPIVTALIVAAAWQDRWSLIDHTAPWLVLARLAQSTVHLISTSESAVRLRFAFMVPQLLILAWWSVQLTLA